MHQFSAKKTDNDSAEIFVYGNIGDYFDGITAIEFIDAVKSFGDVDMINVRINSFGGIAADGTAMMNILRRNPATIIVDIDGYAASAASIVAMAGDKIRMATGSLLMIHDAWGHAAGNAKEVLSYAEGLERASEAISNVYSERTGIDADEIREWMLDEKWFSTEEALAHGFATEAVETLAIAAIGDPSQFKFKHPPRVAAEPIITEDVASEPTTHRLKFAEAARRIRLTRARG